VPPGTQPDGILSDDFLAGMKQASVEISRSQFKIYAYSTRHDLSEAAIDELEQHRLSWLWQAMPLIASFQGHLKHYPLYCKSDGIQL
jgi:hypothetical protein